MTRTQFSHVEVSAGGPVLEVRLQVENKSRETWKPESFSLGWQFFDPKTNLFILEGAWNPVPRDVAPGETASFDVSIPFPP